MASIGARPLDAIEELELAKGCVAVAGKPAVAAEDAEPSVAIELAFDSGADESDDLKVIAVDDRGWHIWHCVILSPGVEFAARAGHFRARPPAWNCCYEALSRRRRFLGERALEQCSDSHRARRNRRLRPPPTFEPLKEGVVQSHLDRDSQLCVVVVFHHRDLAVFHRGCMAYAFSARREGIKSLHLLIARAETL
jgi:hypothetical protein